MKEIFNWKQIDFQFENETHRQTMKESGQFVLGNSIPTAMALWTDKLFFALPRFKVGVPASLAYITINSTGNNSSSVDTSIHQYF